MAAPHLHDTPRPLSERAQATHDALVELAARLFAERGYAQTSMRDIARTGPLSMAAIYLHVKNKAQLLSEAIDRRIDADLERPSTGSDEAASTDLVERLSGAALAFEERTALRSLLVQAAAASLTDGETRQRASDAQLAHIRSWIERYEASSERLGLHDDVDIETTVLYTWAVELGLGMLEAFGMAPRSPEHWAAIQRRLAASLVAEP